MSSVIHLNPEVLELVREIAARPDSVLLRVPRGAEARALREDRPMASATDSALSRAERHLVAVYREEVAYVLRQFAWVRITERRPGEDRIILRHTLNASAPRPDVQAAARHASRMHCESAEVLPETAVGDLLDECLRYRGGPPRSVASLCAASQRLHPSFNARHMAASAFLFSNRYHAASVAGHDALRTASTSEALGLTWTLLAELAAHRGKWIEVEHASSKAIQCYPGLLSPYVGSIWAAVQLSNLEAAKARLRELADMVGRAPEVLAEHAERLECESTRLRIDMPSEARNTLAHLVRGSEPLAGRLFHALV
jgi:hypothetical protein